MHEPILGVIFDLDGVIVSTDDCHYLAWKRMADEEGIPFDRKVNERLRGVSRMASLEIILEKATKTYTEEQKVEMATRKNGYYVELIQKLTAADMLPGAMDTLEMLKKRGVKIAIGSSSKNTPIILRQIGLSTYFDAVADGNQITHSKPNPEVFLLGAKLLGLDPKKLHGGGGRGRGRRSGPERRHARFGRRLCQRQSQRHLYRRQLSGREF